MPERNTKNRKKQLPAKSREELCSCVMAQTPDAIFVCDPDGRITFTNPAAAALLDKTPDELAGCSASELEPALGGIFFEQNALVLSTGQMRTFEYIAHTANGLRTFHITKGVQHDSHGKPGGIFGMVRDITERRIVEQEIINTSDKEKQRLGRELRENFCQHLVGISLLGNALHDELSRAGLAQADDARQIAQLVKEVVAGVRNLEKSLSATHLEQGEGLAEALEDLAEETRSTGRIDCVFHRPIFRHPIEPQTAMYLFRIAQEAVHNALAHAHAHRLEIRLSMKHDAVVLSVRDDGVGFSEKNPALSRQGHIGFAIMQYRSRAIGADLQIKHRPSGGIEVVCTAPLRNTPPAK